MSIEAVVVSPEAAEACVPPSGARVRAPAIPAGRAALGCRRFPRSKQRHLEAARGYCSAAAARPGQAARGAGQLP